MATGAGPSNPVPDQYTPAQVEQLVAAERQALLNQLAQLQAERDQAVVLAEEAQASLANAQANVQAAVEAPAAQADPALVPPAPAPAAAAPVVVAPAAGPRRNDLKPDKPPKFDGNGPDAKPSVDDWCFMVDEWLTLGLVDDDRRKLGLASTLLDGRAATWWRHRARQPGYAGETYEAFKAALCAEFMRVNNIQYTRHKLAMVQQRGSVGQYVAYFRSLLTELPANEVAPTEAYDRFYRGLKPSLAMELDKAYAMDPRRVPNLDDAIIIVSRIDGISGANQQSATQSKNGGGSRQPGRRFLDNRAPNFNSYNNNAYGGFPRGQANGPVPMELGAIASNDARHFGPQGNKLSDNQRAQFAREQRCFRCHQVGHHYRFCRSPLTPGGSGNGRSR